MPGSALALLVLRILLADHPHDALTLDYLAVVANLLDRCLYFHGFSPLVEI